jgi:hypothetical protein
MIRSAAGRNYPLIDSGANGTYISEPLNLEDPVLGYVRVLDRGKTDIHR